MSGAARQNFPSGLADATPITTTNTATSGDSMAGSTGTGASLYASTANTFESQGDLGQVWHLSNGSTATTRQFASLSESSLAVKETYQWSGAGMPGVAQRILDVRLTSGSAWRIGMNTSDQPVLMDSTGATLSTGPTLSAGVEYRFETAGSLSASSAIIKVSLCIGNAPQGDPDEIWTFSTTSGNTTNSGGLTGNITTVNFIQGVNTTGSWGADVGGFQLLGGTTTFLGLFVPTAPQIVLGLPTIGGSGSRGGAMSFVANGTTPFGGSGSRPGTTAFTTPAQRVHGLPTIGGSGSRPGSVAFSEPVVDTEGFVVLTADNDGTAVLTLL